MPETVITVLFLRWWFSVFIIPSTCVIGVLYGVRKSFPFFCIYLLSYIWIFIFILWIIMHSYHCSNFSQFGHWDLLTLPPLFFDMLTSLCWTFPYFLAQDLPDSFCISPAPVRKSALSSRSPGSFCWCLGLKIPRSRHMCQDIIASRPFHEQS